MRTLPRSLVVRRAEPGDLDELVALVGRCSEGTLYRRFHGASDQLVKRELGRIARPTEGHRSWVAVAAGAMRGTATLAWGRSGTVEPAFFVEDAWFRRGVGRSLFAALAAEAGRAGLPSVVATIQADNERAVRFLQAMAPATRPRYVGGAELSVTIPILHVASGSASPGRPAPSTEAA